jgi:ABC-type transport system substrate-binding protein
MEHPVGTGPFRLAEWRRSARIVLERNPGFREQRYDPLPAPDDAAGQAIARALRGRRLPMIDRVEVSIVEEAQPRWLAFLNREHDLLDRLPNEFAAVAIPNDRLAPHLRKRGVRLERAPLVDVTGSYFGREHPVVGGYTPERVALRRAIALAYDVQQEIDLVRRGQAIPAQAIVPPMVSGHDPRLKTEMSDHDLARAKSLALGVRIGFRTAKWPEQLKASRAGRLMMWGVGWSAATPDGTYFLDMLYGPNKGQANHARFALPAFDALYRRQLVMPDGPARDAVVREAALLGVAYMPYKITGHRIASHLLHPWVHGYRRHPFLRDFWRYIDIDAAAVTP